MNHKIGRSLINIMVILVFVVGGIFLYNYAQKQCNSIVKFSVGNVDSRFKINQDEVEKTAEDAASRWNAGENQTLLQYDKNAQLKINLIYDSRQADIDKLNSQSSSLESSQSSLESQKTNLTNLVNSYQKDLAAYNAEVSYWNQKGGAPAEEFTKLNNEKKDLDARKQEIIQISSALNLNIQNYNDDLQNLKNEIDNRKNVIITQGEFIEKDQAINIYTFGNKEELRLVLMHEFGHAIGLDHDQQPQSIMYYLMESQNIQDPRPTSEDLLAIGSRCQIFNKNLYDKLLNLHSAATN